MPSPSIEHAATEKRVSIFRGPQRRLVIGLLASISLVGFETLGVTTAMPEAAKQLGGEAWYGWAFAAVMLGQLVAIAASGVEIDVHGPRRPFIAGLVALTIGLVVGSVANHIALLLLSRLIVGFGAGAIFTSTYATAGLAFDDDTRPRVLAVMSSAWVVPGLIGPFVAGVVTDQISWRWVLAGVLPVIPITAYVAVPPMSAVLRSTANRTATAKPDVKVIDEDAREDVFWAMTGRRRTGLAVVAAIGVSLALGGLQSVDRPVLLVLGVASGLVVLWRALRAGMIPVAALRAQRGLGSVILASATLIGGFSGAEAFVPLALQRLRDFSSTSAGFAISAGTVTWFVGSWLHSRDTGRFDRVGIGRIALGLLATGIAAMGALAWDSFPSAIAVLAWGFGAIGMGIVFNAISGRPFLLVSDDRVGAVSAAVQSMNALGAAITSGACGAIVAATERNGEATGRGIAGVMICQVGVLVLCGVLIGRMSPMRNR